MLTRRMPWLLAAAAAALAVAPGLGEEPSATNRPTPTRLLVRDIPVVSVARMPLLRVLAHYEGLSGLSIEADWPSLKTVGITKETPVTVKATNLSFEKVLDLTLSSIAPPNEPLAWYLSGRTVYISTQARVLLRGRSGGLLPSVGTAGTARTTGTEGAERTERQPQGSIPKQFDFESTPLSLTLEFVANITQVNFHVNWKSLETIGVTKDTPVTLKVKGVSAARALDLILDQLSAGQSRLSRVYWVVEDGVVTVATGDALNQTTSVRVLDVSDLLMVVPNFRGPRIDIGQSTSGNLSGNNNTSSSGGLFGQTTTGGNGSGNGTGDSGEEENIGELRNQRRQTLIDIVKMAIGEDMWAPTGKGDVRIMGSKMIISQTPLGFKLLQEALGK